MSDDHPYYLRQRTLPVSVSDLSLPTVATSIVSVSSSSSSSVSIPTMSTDTRSDSSAGVPTVAYPASSFETLQEFCESKAGFCVMRFL